MIERFLVRVLGRPLIVAGPAGRVDAIVVLGAPLGADGCLTDVLAERVRAGVALWMRGVAPVLCMTGGVTRGAPVSEAEAMAAAARAAGVPESALLVEPTALTTHENARNVARLLGAARVVLVTQPFHLRRARLWFRRYGLDACGWLIADSVQFRAPARGLRWVLREYLGLSRDVLRLRD
jgi:uncharacterized SAM-binding protein YcdF (DUF218 family)